MQLVGEYEASGLGRGEFCRVRELRLSTVVRYRKRPAETGVAGAVAIGRPTRCDRSCSVIPSDSEENVSKARARRMNRNARDRKSTRLNSSHLGISYAVF